MKKIFFNSSIVSFFICLVLGVYLVIFDAFSDIVSKIFLFFFSLFGFGVLSLCSMINSKKKKFYSSVGLFISIIGFVYSILLIFGILSSSLYFNIFYTILLLAISWALICISFLIKIDNMTVKVVKRITIFILLLLDVLFILRIWFLPVPKKLLVAISLLFAFFVVVTYLVYGIFRDDKKVEEKKVSKYEKMDELKELLDTLTISKADFDREKDKILYGDNNKKSKRK